MWTWLVKLLTKAKPKICQGLYIRHCLHSEGAVSRVTGTCKKPSSWLVDVCCRCDAKEYYDTRYRDDDYDEEPL